VKLGLPDTLLYNRYGAWWEGFLSALGVSVVKPVLTKAQSLEAGAKLMPDEAPLMQLFVGRTLELAGNVEALLIPDLNPGSEPGLRGSSSDPWMVDLPSVLGRRFSLPPIYTVPAALSLEDTPAYAVRLGQALVGNAQTVRRVLDRTTNALRPNRAVDPVWQTGGMHTVGVVGNPALLEEPFVLEPALDALRAAKLHPVLGTALPRDRALETGRRKRAELSLETDLETAGAAAMLEQKGQVSGLVVLTEPRSAAQTQFAQSIVKRANKPALLLELGEDYAVKLQPWVLE
jgi:hypothetical protein